MPGHTHQSAFSIYIFNSIICMQLSSTVHANFDFVMPLSIRAVRSFVYMIVCLVPDLRPGREQAKKKWLNGHSFRSCHFFLKDARIDRILARFFPTILFICLFIGLSMIFRRKCHSNSCQPTRLIVALF